MSIFRRRFFAWLTALNLGIAMSTVHAEQAWPTKPVRVTVPSSAGTAPDIIGRVIADKLTRMWGQPVIIENRPGAGAMIALTAVKNGPHDDHGFVFAASSAFVLLPYMFKSDHVDFARDFAPVALAGLSPMMVAVNASMPVNSLEELVEFARKQPEPLVVSTTSLNTFPHLTAHLLSQAAGIPLRAIPYTQSGQAVGAVVGGDAQLVIDGVPPLNGMIEGGRIKPLGIFFERRVDKRPDLPAVAELYPDLVVNGWFGMAALKDTDPKVIEQVNRDVNEVLTMSDVVEKLDTLGVYPRAMTPTEFGNYWKDERARWEQVLRDVGAQPAAG